MAELRNKEEVGDGLWQSSEIERKAYVGYRVQKYTERRCGMMQGSEIKKKAEVGYTGFRNTKKADVG